MTYCVTGTGVTLVSADSTIKFTSGLWDIQGIGGLRRSVQVIDKSHLGIAAGGMMQYCFANIHSLSPLDVDVLVDPDDTTVFPNAETTDGSVPVPLGSIAGDPTTSNSFVLTLATASGNATKLTFSWSRS